MRGLDEQIVVPGPETRERAQADYRAAKKELESRLASEQDPLVKQDLEILIHSADLTIRQSDATYRNLLPNFSPAAVIYGGISGLLDDQVAPERRPAALVRLRKYAGLEPGYTPLTDRAEQWFRERGTRRAWWVRPKSRWRRNWRRPGRTSPASLSCWRNTG